MLMAEEFKRCEKCGEGWFKIEKRVLVEKNSPKWAPVHHKEVNLYKCTNTECNHIQYGKDIEPKE